MRRKDKLNFIGRPDRACSLDELRVSMNYILIDDQCMIATNGHFLVKIPLSLSNLSGDTNLLEGYMIHRKQFMELLKYDIIQLINEGEIRASTDGFHTIFKLAKSTDFTPNYPNYKSILNFEKNPISEIGVNQFVVKQMMTCFDGIDHVGNWRMNFQAANKSIHFTSEAYDDLFGLIMPVMLGSKRD